MACRNGNERALSERPGDGGHSLQPCAAHWRGSPRIGRRSSLGLTPTDPLTAENLREVTGPRMTLVRNPGDAESVSTENVITGVNVAEPTASGLQTFGDAQHHTETAATSGQARAKSPAGQG